MKWNAEEKMRIKKIHLNSLGVDELPWKQTQSDRKRNEWLSSAILISKRNSNALLRRAVAAEM